MFRPKSAGPRRPAPGAPAARPGTSLASWAPGTRRSRNRECATSSNSNTSSSSSSSDTRFNRDGSSNSTSSSSTEETKPTNMGSNILKGAPPPSPEKVPKQKAVAYQEAAAGTVTVMVKRPLAPPCPGHVAAPGPHGLPLNLVARQPRVPLVPVTREPLAPRGAEAQCEVPQVGGCATASRHESTAAPEHKSCFLKTQLDVAGLQEEPHERSQAEAQTHGQAQGQAQGQVQGQVQGQAQGQAEGEPKAYVQARAQAHPLGHTSDGPTSSQAASRMEQLKPPPALVLTMSQRPHGSARTPPPAPALAPAPASAPAAAPLKARSVQGLGVPHTPLPPPPPPEVAAAVARQRGPISAPAPAAQSVPPPLELTPPGATTGEAEGASASPQAGLSPPPLVLSPPPAPPPMVEGISTGPAAGSFLSFLPRGAAVEAAPASPRNEPQVRASSPGRPSLGPFPFPPQGLVGQGEAAGAGMRSRIQRCHSVGAYAQTGTMRESAAAASGKGALGGIRMGLRMGDALQEWAARGARAAKQGSTRGSEPQLPLPASAGASAAPSGATAAACAGAGRAAGAATATDATVFFSTPGGASPGAGSATSGLRPSTGTQGGGRQRIQRYQSMGALSNGQAMFGAAGTLGAATGHHGGPPWEPDAAPAPCQGPMTPMSPPLRGGHHSPTQESGFQSTEAQGSGGRRSGAPGGSSSSSSEAAGLRLGWSRGPQSESQSLQRQTADPLSHARRLVGGEAAGALEQRRLRRHSSVSSATPTQCLFSPGTWGTPLGAPHGMPQERQSLMPTLQAAALARPQTGHSRRGQRQSAPVSPSQRPSTAAADQVAGVFVAGSSLGRKSPAAAQAPVHVVQPESQAHKSHRPVVNSANAAERTQTPVLGPVNPVESSQSPALESQAVPKESAPSVLRSHAPLEQAGVLAHRRIRRCTTVGSAGGTPLQGPREVVGRERAHQSWAPFPLHSVAPLENPVGTPSGQREPPMDTALHSAAPVNTPLHSTRPGTAPGPPQARPEGGSECSESHSEREASEPAGRDSRSGGMDRKWLWWGARSRPGSALPEREASGGSLPLESTRDTGRSGGKTPSTQDAKAGDAKVQAREEGLGDKTWGQEPARQQPQPSSVQGQPVRPEGTAAPPSGEWNTTGCPHQPPVEYSLATPQHPHSSPQHPPTVLQQPFAGPQHSATRPEHPPAGPQQSGASPEHPPSRPHHPAASPQPGGALPQAAFHGPVLGKRSGDTCDAQPEPQSVNSLRSQQPVESLQQVAASVAPQPAGVRCATEHPTAPPLEATPKSTPQATPQGTLEGTTQHSTQGPRQGTPQGASSLGEQDGMPRDATESTQQGTPQGPPRASQALGARRVRQFLSIHDIPEAPPAGDGRGLGAVPGAQQQEGAVAILRRAQEIARANKYRLMRQNAQAQPHSSMAHTRALRSCPDSHPLAARHFWTQMKFQAGTSGPKGSASSQPGGTHSTKQNEGFAPQGGKQAVGRPTANVALLESLVVRCGPYSDARACSGPTLKGRQVRLWWLRHELVALMEAKRRSGKLRHCNAQGAPGSGRELGPPRHVQRAAQGTRGVPEAAMGPLQGPIADELDRAGPGTPGAGLAVSQQGVGAPLDPFFLAHVARLWGRVTRVEFEGQQAADCIEVLYGGILVGKFERGREELAPPTGIPPFDGHIDRILSAVGEHFYACYCSV